jgi:hypothetical protein
MQTTTTTTTTVIAEDAPIGVQLWPTRSPEFAPNFTLAKVITTRTAAGECVTWVYENGTERTFAKGEGVACKL